MPQPAGVLDLQALARNIDQQRTVGLPIKAQPSLFILVSFSAPQQTLELLVSQAERAGATLVLRGLDQGSLRATVARAQKLIGKHKVSFQIDPQAFERFGVNRVPAFVLVKSGQAPAPCAAGMCFASDDFVAVAGDVSLDYALEHMERNAPAYAKQTRPLLLKLKG